MAPLAITLACGPYDRTRALADGRVTVGGADLRYLPLDPEEIFFRMLNHGEFDVSEMSLATYVITREAGRPFVAIPVFPSRMFRHTGVYVNGDRMPGGAGGAAAARALAGALSVRAAVGRLAARQFAARRGRHGRRALTRWWHGRGLPGGRRHPG